MKYLLLLLLVATTAYAQDKKSIMVEVPIQCFTTDTLLVQLKDKYGEEPIFVGKSTLETEGVTFMYVNQDSGTYTVVTANKDVACVLDTGKNTRYRYPKMLEKPQM